MAVCKHVTCSSPLCRICSRTDVGFIIGIIAGAIMNSLSPDDGVNIILGIAYLMVIVTFFTAPLSWNKERAVIASSLFCVFRSASSWAILMSSSE